MDKRQWNMLFPGPIGGSTVPEELTAFALAYIDSAVLLGADLVARPELATFERASVVLSLWRHSFELFLKGALARTHPTERFGHDVEHLFGRYEKLYPAQRFRFTGRPFQGEYGNLTTQEIATAKKIAPPSDQFSRYTRNKFGNHWPGAHGIEIHSCLREMKVLREDYIRLLREYDN